VQFDTARSGIEKRRRTVRGISNVLHQDNRHALRPRPDNGRFDLGEHCLGIPQREFAVREIVVLQIDDDQRALWCRSHAGTPEK